MMYTAHLPGPDEPVTINSEYPFKKGDELTYRGNRYVINSMIYHVIDIDNPPSVHAEIFLVEYRLSW